MPLQRQKASRRPQLRGHSSLFRDQPRAWSRRRQRPGLTAPPHSALPNGAACIPLHRALCSRFAFARRTLIKSLPGQELRTGSDLRAFNKENRLRHARVGPPWKTFVPGLAGPFLYSAHPHHRVFAVFLPLSSLPHPILGFVICGSSFNTELLSCQSS